MAVSLLSFVDASRLTLADKAYNLVKCWRVGIKPCIAETDLVVLSMYLKVLTTDLTSYNFSTTDVNNIVYSIVNIFNITNVVIDQSTITQIITNTYPTTYVTTVVNQMPSYTMTYSGIDNFTVTVPHNLNKYNCTVIVTDTTSGRVRVYPSITETDLNTISIEFESTSSGEIKVM